MLESKSGRQNSWWDEFLRRAEEEPLADRVGIGEKTARKRFVDHRDWQCAARVAIAEGPAFEDRNRQRAEVIGAHLAVLQVRHFLERFRCGAVFNRKQLA